MCSRLKQKKAQNTIEYAGIIALTVVVLMAMHNYMNRGLQGKLKENLDTLNDEQFAGTGRAKGSAFSWENRQMNKGTTTFSYEGGQYEGSISTSFSSRSDTSRFRSPK